MRLTFVQSVEQNADCTSQQENVVEVFNLHESGRETLTSRVRETRDVNFTDSLVTEGLKPLGTKVCRYTTYLYSYYTVNSRGWSGGFGGTLVFQNIITDWRWDGDYWRTQWRWNDPNYPTNETRKTIRDGYLYEFGDYRSGSSSGHSGNYRTSSSNYICRSQL